jgi:hypothetical protein
MKRGRNMMVLGVVVSLAAALGALAQDYSIDWYTIDGGGEMFSTGGSYELSSTIAQQDAGGMSGGTYSLTGGFWFEHVCGDCNNDAGVDLLDYQYIPTCLSGPSGGLLSGCGCLDFDVDEDVDLADFAEFQAALTGW